MGLGGGKGTPVASGGSHGAVSNLLASGLSTRALTVDAGIVDVTTVLGYEGERAAGTGVVLSATGEVLTNNHVIEGATSIQVRDVGNGRTYGATVIGYDRRADVAVLQLEHASGLATATLAPGQASVGDAVWGYGNAGGGGGVPSVAAGSVTALGRSIDVRNDLSGSVERLSGLIETNADVVPGDSGGPLVTAAGAVVGIDTAASSSNQVPGGARESYAIPIATALGIASRIESGTSGPAIHVGRTALLGVQVATSGTGVAGALVEAVDPGSAAAAAGVVPGDTVTSISGVRVASAAALSNAIQGIEPGAPVIVGWEGAGGVRRSASARLSVGPPQ